MSQFGVETQKMFCSLRPQHCFVPHSQNCGTSIYKLCHRPSTRTRPDHSSSPHFSNQIYATVRCTQIVVCYKWSLLSLTVICISRRFYQTNKKLTRRWDSQTWLDDRPVRGGFDQSRTATSRLGRFARRGWSPWTIFVIFGGWVAGWPGYNMVQK